MNNYFSHDSNARNSDKLIRVRMKHGAEGYGIYFMILERLRDEPDYTSVADYEMIAYDLRCSADLVRSVIEDFSLFIIDKEAGIFWSAGLKDRMEKKEETSRLRADAGRKGMKRRWEKQKISSAVTNDNEAVTNDEVCYNKTVTNDNNKRKVKESKGKDNNIPPLPPAREKESPPSVFELSLADCKAELLNRPVWQEQFVMNVRAAGFPDFSPDGFRQYLEQFFAKLQNEGEQSKSPKDAMSHFARWLKNELNNAKKNNHEPKSRSPDHRTAPPAEAKSAGIKSFTF